MAHRTFSAATKALHVVKQPRIPLGNDMLTNNMGDYFLPDRCPYTHGFPRITEHWQSKWVGREDGGSSYRRKCGCLLLMHFNSDLQLSLSSDGFYLTAQH